MEKAIQALGLVHPCDRNRAVLKDRMSTAELDASLETYRQACARTAEQVQAQLKALARRLMVSAPNRSQCGNLPRVPTTLLALPSIAVRFASHCHSWQNWLFFSKGFGNMVRKIPEIGNL